MCSWSLTRSMPGTGNVSLFHFVSQQRDRMARGTPLAQRRETQCEAEFRQSGTAYLSVSEPDSVTGTDLWPGGRAPGGLLCAGEACYHLGWRDDNPDCPHHLTRTRIHTAGTGQIASSEYPAGEITGHRDGRKYIL
jgi:hypothetical protein